MSIQHRIKIIRIIVNDTGTIEVGWLWNDQEFSEVYEDYARMIQIMQDPIQEPHASILAVMGWWLARDPDGSNQTLVLDKEFKVDYGDPNPIKVN